MLESAKFVFVVVVASIVTLIPIALIYRLVRYIEKLEKPEDQEKARRRDRLMFRIAAGVFAALGLGFGIYSAVFIATGIRTSGTIVEIREKKDGKNGGTWFKTVFAFTNETGVRFEVAPSVASGGPQFRIGHTVPVVYLKARPDSARIDTFVHHWFGPTGLGIGAIFFFAVGELSYLLGKFRSSGRRIGIPLPRRKLEM